MNEKELEQILENHRHWLKEDCEGWENMRANLEGAYLKEANLEGANLEGAYLCGANFCGANLYGANLKEANLKEAYLKGANLYGANLEGAYLKGAYFCGANLEGAYLYGANLKGANLKGAYLCGANFYGANLYGANLKEAYFKGAYLCGANLYGANLYGAKDMPYIPMVCPEEGKFIGWKKAEVQEEENHYRKVIVKLEIPASAKRSSATSRKCRCNKAKVLEIYNLNGTVAEERKCLSSYDNDFVYEVGKTVKVDDFCEDRWNECSTGIHFFINRQEAINY